MSRSDDSSLFKAELDGRFQLATSYDLPVLHPDGDIGPVYRVFECRPDNFKQICRLLHGRDWLHDGIAPLVVSRFPLSKQQAASLPRRVPWLSIGSATKVDLDALRELLVEPLQDPGWICVDFMDYAAALSCGGEMRWWRAKGRSVEAASAKLTDQVASAPLALLNPAACCLRVQMPSSVTMRDVDSAASVIDDGVVFMGRESLVVMSAQMGGVEYFQISLICVSGVRR